MNEQLIAEIFDDIILGRGVKQSIHELIYLGRDFSSLFVQRLNKNGYESMHLKEIDIEIGYRIPGFLIMSSTAWFGHLFWEVFSDRRNRKIWGSVVRNQKSDWNVIISGNSSEAVFLNLSKKQSIDIYHLT